MHNAYYNLMSKFYEFIYLMPEEQAILFWQCVSIIVLVLGAMIGSFLNVCIYRIPLNQSVSRPRSHCFSCNKVIPWYHNIPVFSWILLRGRCANCKAPFSPRYMVIEAITALLFLLVFQMWINPSSFGLTKLQFPILIPFYWCFVASTIVNIGIDIDHRILLDRISLGGTLFTLLVAMVVPELLDQTTWLAGLTTSLIGALTGFSIGYAIAFFGEKIFLQDAFGFGDVKWMMLFGAIFGWQGVLFILMLAAFIGLIIGLPMMIITRKQHAESEPFAMPFGPALGIGAIVWLFWRTQILRAIQNGKTFIETHDAAVLLVLFPMLILTSSWLVYRIVMIRRAIREEEANENNLEQENPSLEDTPLTPIEESTPPEV
jgi:leader peptidase (prepilin peptidase)/N-methyltransferase